MRATHLAWAAALLIPLSVAPAQANLLTDGDFSSNTIDFTTGYPFVATNHTVFTAPPATALVTDPDAAFTNGYDSYTDHTGDAKALMLFVDGQSTTSFWGQTVALAPNTGYTFSYWATGADGANQATLQLLVNSVANDLGNPLTTVGQWVQYSETFTTGASGSTDLSLIDLVGIDYGNDFTVDDLDLEANPPPPPGGGARAGHAFIVRSGACRPGAAAAQEKGISRPIKKTAPAGAVFV